MCPTGLKGPNCNIIDNPCDKNPCQNNGNCISITRSIDDDHLHSDSLFKEFQCVCPPYFYGKLCDIFIKPDYTLKFNSNGVNDYVQIKGPTYDLKEVIKIEMKLNLL